MKHDLARMIPAFFPRRAVRQEAPVVQPERDQRVEQGLQPGPQRVVGRGRTQCRHGHVLLRNVLVPAVVGRDGRTTHVGIGVQQAKGLAEVGERQRLAALECGECRLHPVEVGQSGGRARPPRRPEGDLALGRRVQVGDPVDELAVQLGQAPAPRGVGGGGKVRAWACQNLQKGCYASKQSTAKYRKMNEELLP
jgi:hypothetical protein